jgi:predicted small metal-binding protein
MKTLSCKDAGMDCDFVARGATEDEVISNAMAHGKMAHNLQESDFTPQMRGKMKSLIKEEGIRKVS